jgi:hypothetical protein
MGIKYSIELNEDQLKLLSVLDYDILPSFSISPPDIDKLGWSKSKARRVVRSLYGIFAIEEEEPWHFYKKTQKTVYRHFYIPSENIQPVKDALGGDGRFRGEVETEDLPVLKTVYERDRELKTLYGHGWNPRFFEAEVAKRANMSKGKTRKGLDRLVGVLARTNLREWKRVLMDNKYELIMLHRPQWFLPKARIPQADKILNTDI